VAHRVLAHPSATEVLPSSGIGDRWRCNATLLGMVTPMRRQFLAAAVVFGAWTIASGGAAQTSGTGLADRYIEGMFSTAAPEWKGRIAQDETQRVCSLYHNDPPAPEAEKVRAREQATVVFPAGGVQGGDWKRGEAIAQSGQGGQFSDGASIVHGGNCYACHQLAPHEVSYGTLGPSLLAYGKLRGFSSNEAEAAYAKIYNAQAITPCSLMPRFGYHKFLTEDQLKDVLAYLFDPQSPVNK
jgi:L-cysteine S-thiosulfotransferase